MEIGYGRELNYQPGEHEWAMMLKQMDDILRASGQLRDDEIVDAQWESDELQKRFVLSRKPGTSVSGETGLLYALIIEDSLSSEEGGSMIALQDTGRGITTLLGPICEEVKTGLSAEPEENAELLLRLYLSSYTMDNNV